MLSTVILLTLMSLQTEVSSWTEDWYDTARERSVPVRFFAPDSNEKSTPAPLILLSHGLGGSREGFGYLGQALSENGYIAAAMQHTGSDANLRTARKSGETSLQAMARAANADEAQHRYEDVKFILAELEERNREKSKNAEHSLTGKIDFDKVGIGGHSFGSHTSFAAAGRFPYKRIDKIKAAVLMSPNMPSNVNPAFFHKNLSVPMLHLTGTNDGSPLDKSFDPNDRRIPFDNINGADQYLIIFDGGNHMLFSGHPRPLGRTPMEKKCQPVIAEIITLFFDAYVKENETAMKKIQGGGLTEMMKTLGTAEKKLLR